MKYDIIYVDPPWPYNTWTKATVPNRRGRGMADSVYSKGVMTMDDIKALPITKVANKSAALVLWTTGPRLPEAFKVAEAWDFNHYSTVLFSWLKTNPNCQVKEPELLEPKDFKTGIGYWTQSNIEIALLFLRGPKKPKRAATGVRQVVLDKQVVIAPVREHSEKPVELYDRITKLFGPDKTYLEVFGRRLWPGWTVIGDEIENQQDITESLAKLAALDLAAPPKTSIDLAPNTTVAEWEKMLKPYSDLNGQLRFKV